MERATRFGTFGGVFTPALLTILSVIMYLRLGWIVGQAGLLYTIGIILVANVIAVATGLSLSSIATDKKVKAGGVYFMLSRSLGLPIGGAIGATIYLAFALSIALNIVGFAENFLSVDAVRNLLNLQQDIISIRIVGVGILVILTTIAYISTSLAIKTQYFVLTAIVLSLLSIFLGLFLQSGPGTAEVHLLPAANAPSFSVLFAIFFPAATGFMMGAAMSGDLKDPKSSIPKGTMLAIFTGMVINISLAVGFAYFVDRDLLLSDSAFLQKVALVPPLVFAGIWGATLSTALGAILGGPRVIQAMAKDRLAPEFLGKGHGINNEPHRAIFLTFLIALPVILIGELNTIARIASIFFITAYAFINLAFSLESWASTDFRPSFKIPRWVGWIGFAASIIVMIQIDVLIMIIAATLIWLTWFIMKNRQQMPDPGDVWQSVWSNIVRRSVHNIYTHGIEERNWKPNIMLFSGNPETRLQLIELGKALIADHGLLTIINLQKYRPGEKTISRLSQRQTTPEEIAGAGVFSREYHCHDIYQGIMNLAETYGFAGVEPNTVLMGWTRKTTDATRFTHMIQHIIDLDLNLLLMDIDTRKGFGDRKSIDIWWRGPGNNGNLALNLVKFLWLSEGWKDSFLRLLIENPVNDDHETIFNFAREVLDNLRINAEIVIINNEIEQKPFYDLIRIESGNSDVTFLSIPEIIPGQEEDFLNEIHRLSVDLGTVVLIKASTQFKRLNIGLKPSVIPLRSILEKPVIKPGPVFETQINFPSDAALAAPLREFADKMILINKETVEKSFSKILSQYAEIVKNAHNRVYATYTIISKKLTELQQPDGYEKVSTAFYKLNANSFTRYEQILLYLRDTLISEQQRIIEVCFPGSEKKIMGMINQLPEKLDIRTTQGNRKVPFRSVIKAFFPQIWLQDRVLLWHRFMTLSGEYLSEQQKVFRHFRDSVISLENALKNSTLTEELIRQEKQQIENDFVLMDDFLSDAIKSLMATAIAGTVEAFTEISEILQSENPRLSLKNSRRKFMIRKKEFLLSTDTWAADWKQLQHLAINKDLLDISLSEISYKLWHFINNAADEIAESWYNADEPSPLQQPARILEFTETTLQLIRDGEPFAQPQLNTTSDNTLSARIREIEEHTSERITTALSKLPGHIELLKPHVDPAVNNYSITQTQLQSVAVSRLAHFIVQNNLLAQFQSDLKEFIIKSKQAEQEMIEINRLIRVTMIPDQEETPDMSLENFLEEQKYRTQRLQNKLNDLQVTIHDKLHFALNNTTRLLGLSLFIKTAENLKLAERKAEINGHAVSGWRTHLGNIRDFFRRNLVSLWYDRSRRIVYAMHSRVAGAEEMPVGLFHELCEQVTPKEKILSTVPPYYQQLFLRKNNYFMDFWYGKPVELAEAEKAIKRHAKGFHGAILIRGEHNSGKTFMANYIAHRYLEKRPVYVINPSFAGSARIADFEKAIQKSIDNFSGMHNVLEALPDKSVIIIEDMELWWEKTNQGLGVINLIFDLVEAYSDKILFILTINSHALFSLKQFVKTEPSLQTVLDCKPFNAEELKDVTMLRHRSGNLQFVYRNTRESDMQLWDFAKLFNTYFNYTKGNVGLCLQTWITSIEKAEGNIIHIKTPERPDLTALNSLNSDILVFLAQFILHKRITPEKMERIMLMPTEEVKENLRLLKLAAIITEPAQGVFILNPALHLFIREKLIEKELI
jgi:amino acid transporter